MKTKLQVITECLVKLVEELNEPDTRGMKSDEVLKLVLAGKVKPRTAAHEQALKAHLTSIYGEHDPDAMTFPEGHPAIPVYGKYDPRYNPVKSPAAKQRGEEMSASIGRGIHLHAHGEAEEARQKALARGMSEKEAQRVYDAAYAKAHDKWSK